MHRYVALIAFTCALVPASSSAQDDKYQITAEEKAACTPDAEQLCAAAYPDEDKLVACLKVNRKALSPACAAVFKAGLKDRGLR